MIHDQFLHACSDQNGLHLLMKLLRFLESFSIIICMIFFPTSFPATNIRCLFNSLQHSHIPELKPSLCHSSFFFNQHFPTLYVVCCICDQAFLLFIQLFSVSCVGQTNSSFQDLQVPTWISFQTDLFTKEGNYIQIARRKVSQPYRDHFKASTNNCKNIQNKALHFVQGQQRIQLRSCRKWRSDLGEQRRFRILSPVL